MKRDAWLVYREDRLNCGVAYKPVSVFEREERAKNAAARAQRARRRDQCGDCRFEVARVREVE
jgi:hypothetical protein